MRKLALIATVAALSIPAAAQAGMDRNDNEQAWYKGQTTAKAEIVGNDDRIYKVNKGDENRTLSLTDGRTLRLKGDAAYLVSSNAGEFFAPDGEYEATSGIKYFTNDGVLIYATTPADEFVVTADVQDDNRNGYADDVEISANYENN